MLQRHFTTKIINQFANHPSVYPYIKNTVEGAIDLSAQVKNQNNVCLVGEHGCVLFYKQQFGIFEYHTCVLPEGRGEWALMGAKHAFNYMFTKTDAFELMTRCPDGNIASKALSRLIGMKKVFRTLPTFKMNEKFVCCDVMSLTLQDWAVTDEFLVSSGIWFHEELERQYKAMGLNIPIHEEDETHNRYVGCAVEMIRSGLIIKGIAFYNRWANIAGYAPINIISTEPLILDIRDARLRVFQDRFEVINASNSRNSGC